MPPIPTTEKRPFIPAVGVVQAEMVYRCLTQLCENVYHFQLHADGSASTITEMQTLATQLENWEHNQMTAARHNGTILDHIVVRALDTQSSPAIVQAPTTTVTGLVTDAPPPNNVTFAVKWTTPLRGRSFRGRTYHIGIGSGRYAGNQLLSTVVTAMVPLYAKLFDGTGAVPAAKLCVLSYADHKFWRAAALPTLVTAVSIDANMDSQRRRLAGRGQ